MPKLVVLEEDRVLIPNSLTAAAIIHLDEASHALHDISVKHMERISRGDLPDDPEDAALVFRAAADLEAALSMTRSALHHAARGTMPGVDCDVVLTDDELAGPPIDDASGTGRA